jgi:uncharacterized protein YtpQ (UPF0354 family)
METMMTTPLGRLQRLFGFGREPEALTLESSRARLLRAEEVTPEMVRDHLRIVATALPRVRLVQPQDAFNVAITLEDGATATVHIREILLMLRERPGERDLPLANWEASIRNTIETLVGTLDPARLIPVLRSRAMVEPTAEERARGQDKSHLIVRPLVGDLVAVLSEDFPERLVSVTPQALDRAGLDQAQAFAAADANLERMSRDARREQFGDFIGIQLDGTYEATLIQAKALWEGLAAEFGALAVAVPTRECLLIAPAADATRVEGLQNVARRFFAERSYRITDQLYHYELGRWSVLPN